MTWRTLCIVADSIMVHARVSEAYVHFSLMYTTYHIFPVIPIKDLIKKYGDSKIPHKLTTDRKPSVSHLRVLFCPCVVRKATAHVETKTLNMFHQEQKGFCSIFISIPKHRKGYLVYVPSKRKVISSYDVVFDESFSSALTYTSKPYSEEIVMRLSVTYTTYGTSLREKTGNIMTFTQFEEGNILTKTSNDAESGDESDTESIMMSKQDMENIDEKENFDYNHISMETLHDIREGNQTHPNIDKREAHLKISDRIKQKK